MLFEFDKTQLRASESPSQLPATSSVETVHASAQVCYPLRAKEIGLQRAAPAVDD